MRPGSPTPLDWIVCLIFVTSALLQYNDPDALPWVALYLAAAAVCVVPARGTLRFWPPAIVGLTALAWSLMLVPQALPGFRVGQLFETMQAETPRIEIAREALGLLIVTAWMTVLVLRRRSRTDRSVNR